MRCEEDPLIHGAAEHSVVAPPPPGCPAWLAGLNTPDGCARTLLTALGRNGEAARRRAAELGSRCLGTARFMRRRADSSGPVPRSLACLIECDVFADALPKNSEGRTSAYVAALRRCSACVAQSGEAAPSHTTLLAAEGCVIHKAYAALLSASVVATRAATEELHEGCSLLSARIALPAGLDLGQANAHLVALKSCTLPLCVPMQCLALALLTWF